jgi:uncharacterized phage infection (PIP) family protein YhgE
VGSADIIRTRIEQFIQPTITTIINQYNTNLDRVNDEIADLTEQVKEQKRQINLLATSTRMDFDQDKEEEDALMEKRIRDRNNKLKQELEQLDNDIAQLVRY